MALQFVTKRFRKNPNYIIVKRPKVEETPTVDDIKLESPKIEEKEKANTKIRNNKKKQKNDMIDKNQISAIEDAIKNMQPEVKVVKKDRGLIERTESSKIIITEDNRQVLND